MNGCKYVNMMESSLFIEALTYCKMSDMAIFSLVNRMSSAVDIWHLDRNIPSLLFFTDIHFVINVTIMGGVTSIPQVLGGLVTRLLYSLIGANYYTRSLAPDKQHSNPLELWRGKDYHVYDRYG